MNPNIGKRIGDTSDLPHELKAMLGIRSADQLTKKIISTLKDRYGGIASINEILVGLYRDHKYIAKDRKKIGSKLYRMSQDGLLEAVPKRKGVFRIKGGE